MEPVDVNAPESVGPAEESEETAAEETISEELLFDQEQPAIDTHGADLRAIIEAVIYVTDEPLTAVQIAAAVGQPVEQILRMLDELAAEYMRPEHGLTIREVAGGYKMGTKPEHHEAIRAFVKNLKPPLKLSLAALETLAVVAYKQPITAPEIMDIRGVQGAGVLKTLLDRRLIATAGRKAVLGKPILYKTTKEFLVQFGLKDVGELPSLKEFEELGRMALSEDDAAPAQETPVMKAPREEPPAEPDPVREPGPEPEPEREPDPTREPGGAEDPEIQPVREP